MSSTLRVNQVYLYKLKGHPFWPVQLYKVEKDIVTFVYFGSGQSGSLPRSSVGELVPFTQENIKTMKLDKIKSTKLREALKLANQSV